HANLDHLFIFSFTVIYHLSATSFPYTTLFRSLRQVADALHRQSDRPRDHARRPGRPEAALKRGVEVTGIAARNPSPAASVTGWPKATRHLGESPPPLCGEGLQPL